MRMLRSWSNSAVALACAPRSPMRLAGVGSSASAASRVGQRRHRRRRGTSTPVRPSSTTWRQPRMSLATTGRPDRGRLHGRAGEALPVRGQHVDVERRVDRLDVAALADEARRRSPLDGRRRSAWPKPSDLSGSRGPTMTNRALGDAARGARRGGLEHLAQALLPHEPAHRADDHVVVVEPELGPAPRPGAPGSASGVNRARSMPLPSVTSFARGHPEPAQHRDVLGALHQLDVGAARGDPLQRVDDGTAGPGVVRRGVEAVHRVDHHRAPGPTGPRAGRTSRASGCGCGRCRAAPGGTPGTARRMRAASRRGSIDRVACARATWRMPAASIAATYGPGRRRRHHLVAGGRERLELRSEQQLEADVRGRDVDDLGVVRAHVRTRFTRGSCPRDGSTAADQSPPHPMAPSATGGSAAAAVRCRGSRPVPRQRLSGFARQGGRSLACSAHSHNRPRSPHG